MLPVTLIVEQVLSISGLVGDNNLLFADIGQATASSSSALAADHTGFLVSTDYSLTSNQRACGLDAYFNNTGGFNYPDTITGRTVYSRIYASHHNSIRGEIPGIVFPCHPRPFTTFFVDLPQEGAFVGQNWFILPKMTTSTDGGALTYLSTFAIRYNCDTSDWYSV
jgi:hypothetical protein